MSMRAPRPFARGKAEGVYINRGGRMGVYKRCPMPVACGDQFLAVLTERGGLWVFGANEAGQLGIGSLARSDAPTLLGGVGLCRGTRWTC